MSELEVRLSFPAKPDYLLLARLALSGLAREMPLDDEAVADLKLALTEACGNAVRHAYPGGSGDVVVSYVVADGALQLVVEDEGVGVGTADLSTGPITGPVDSGMGMSIIGSIVDEVDVSSGPLGRGTVVRMTKRLGAFPQSRIR